MSNHGPHLVIIAGPNGSGKSTSAAALIRDHFGVLEYVNADIIAQGLWGVNVDSVAIQAGRLMLSRIDQLAAASVSFAVETTLASRSLVARIKQMHRKGYQAHLVFLWLRSAELAQSRVALRVQQGGHDVPAETIKRRYTRGMGIQNLLNLYLPFMQSWAVYNASVGPPPRQVAVGNADGLTLNEPDTWALIQETVHEARQ